MADGTIKKLVADRGFGFIAGSDGSEYFFHRDGVDNFDSLRGGEKVTFVREEPGRAARDRPRRVARAPGGDERVELAVPHVGRDADLLRPEAPGPRRDQQL